MIGLVAAYELLERPVRDGDAVQWRIVHDLLLTDELVLAAVKARCTSDVLEHLDGDLTVEVRTFVFSRAYLAGVAQRRLLFGADGVPPEHMGAVVAIGQRPLPHPADGHACSAYLPGPYRRPCSWCGAR